MQELQTMTSQIKRVKNKDQPQKLIQFPDRKKIFIGI
mgnify:FL=1